jgi:hypothetical protein
MNSEKFNQLCEDVGYIKGKVEVLENAYMPCEKKEIKKSITSNRTMIWSLYGFWGIVFIGVVGFLASGRV